MKVVSSEDQKENERWEMKIKRKEGRIRKNKKKFRVTKARKVGS
jgi:hypothetical protein